MQRRAILERMLEKTNRSQHFFLTIRPILSSISANSDQTNSIPLPEVFEKPLFARILQVTGLLSLAPLGACEPAVEQGYQPPAPAQSTCGADSELRASLYGSIETTLQWTGSDMGCESMPRPNGRNRRRQRSILQHARPRLLLHRRHRANPFAGPRRPIRPGWHAVLRRPTRRTQW